MMTEKIHWEREWDNALHLATAEDKPILLFFHNPD